MKKAGPGLSWFSVGYLMMERQGMAATGPKSADETPTVLRFHVQDTLAAVAELGREGIAVDVRRFDWGVIGIFADPDGNPCELAEVWDVT